MDATVLYCLLTLTGLTACCGLDIALLRASDGRAEESFFTIFRYLLIGVLVLMNRIRAGSGRKRDAMLVPLVLRRPAAGAATTACLGPKLLLTLGSSLTVCAGHQIQHLNQ